MCQALTTHIYQIILMEVWVAQEKLMECGGNAKIDLYQKEGVFWSD